MGIIKKVPKQSLLYSLFFAIVLSLSACATTERQVAEDTNIKADALEEWKDKLPKDMPEHLELELNGGGIEIDAFLEVSKELTDWRAEELVLRRHLFDETKCLDDLLKLLGNPKVLKREKFVKEDTLEDGTPLKGDNAELEGDAYSFAQARNLYFLADFPERTKIDISNDFITDREGLFDKVEKNKELAFGGYKNVCQEIKKFLKGQEIENVLEPDIYSFSPELLQKVADEYYEEFARVDNDREKAKKYQLTLGEEDGVYLIRYTQGHKGIPYSYLPLVDSAVDGNIVLSGSYMCVLYGRQGIQSVSGRAFYDMTEMGEEKDILSLYDILNKVSEHFNSSSDKKTKIKEIGLCYLPIIRNSSKLEFTGVPVWYLVYSEEIAEGTGTARSKLTFDARTGEIYG
ncbi:MAG: hypothetical protein K2N51_13250 [Lachnospiraceae bacterium]|nr:hypothetical protein [Lachnospiraceae bacterium]